MKSQHKNPYFCASANFSSPSLEKYIASTKSTVGKLVNKPIKSISNMTSSERATLNSLKSRDDIVITRADKGGKVVVMDKQIYISNCETQLDNTEFYEKISADPTEDIAKNIRDEITNMTENNLIDEKESHVIMGHLDKPRLSIFYGLPKIHKTFKEFPPLRPIVSGFNSCTARLSEYLGTL